jgi:antitoxin component YwqK of YwqJK toxin-antitoxin module
MRSIYILTVITIIFCACNSGTTTTGAASDLTGYETEQIAGTNVTRAYKKNGVGDIIEEGYVSNGKRNGTWMTYWENENAGRIKTIASYSDGLLNGPYLEFSNRSQIEKEVNYANNKYNGRFAQYKFGRVEKEINYKDNVLDGKSIDYNTKGNKQKEVNYKNGKLDGKWITFNEEGTVTLEYIYKNGEKVSGGIIEQ